MSRLYGMCFLVLLVYGLVVGCSDGVHRESRVEVLATVENTKHGFRPVTYVIFLCEHHHQTYMERWVR